MDESYSSGALSMYFCFSSAARWLYAEKSGCACRTGSRQQKLRGRGTGPSAARLWVSPGWQVAMCQERELPALWWSTQGDVVVGESTGCHLCLLLAKPEGGQG